MVKYTAYKSAALTGSVILPRINAWDLFHLTSWVKDRHPVVATNMA